MKKIIFAILVVMGISFNNNIIEAATKEYVEVTADVTGDEFFKAIDETEKNLSIFVKVYGKTEEEIETKLDELAERVKEVSNKGLDYGISAIEYEDYNIGTSSFKEYFVAWTEDIKEIESGFYKNYVNEESKRVYISTYMSGEEFLKQAKKYGDYYFCIYAMGTTREEKLENLRNFENKIREASKKDYSYNLVNEFDLTYIDSDIYRFIDYQTLKGKDITAVENSTLEINVNETSGNQFLDRIHKNKKDERVILKIRGKSKKEIDKTLKKFAKDVKKASKYDLVYGIYTKEHRDLIKSLDNKEVTIVLKEGTRDLVAAEKMIAKIKNWGKMNENNRFLALADACNKVTKYESNSRNEFHFYKKKNRIVCRYYAEMYVRIVELITTNCETQLVSNQEIHHRLVLIRVGKEYYEGNNVASILK